MVFSMFNNSSKKYYFIIFILLVCISVGYAILNNNLSINGKSNISKNVWNIYLDNVQLKKGSATSNIPNIIGNDTIEVNVVLNNPGDYYSFTFDIVNAGTLNAIIENIELESDIKGEQFEIIRYEMFYDNGDSYDSKQYLMAGETKKVRVLLEYIREISPEKLPSEVSSFNLTCRLIYSQIEKNPDAYIQATGYSWNQIPGITIYDALNNKREEMKKMNISTYPYPTEFTVVHPDITHVFVNENGRVLNLKNTIVESGKMYQSTSFSLGSKISEDVLNTEDYVTVFIDTTQILSASFVKISRGECEGTPVFVDSLDTYVNVMHAIYPNGYFLGDANVVKGFEQELIDEYILGFPSGQDAGGCENGTLHKFFVFMDEDDKLLKMTDKVNHMDKRKVKMFSIDDSEMTWEEAKKSVKSQLEFMIS